MELSDVRLLKGLVLLLILIIFSVVLMTTAFGNKLSKISSDTKQLLDVKMKRSRFDFLNYDRINLFLKRYGVAYMFEDKVDPLTFIMVKFMCAIFLAFIVIKVAPTIVLAIPAAIFGYLVPDFLVKISNDSDNDSMMDDIKKIYDTLKIQTRAGVYLTDSLSECYLVVKNKRLKLALLELSSKIVAKNDIETAINEFNLQFYNGYIDTFCIIIKQAQQSGRSVEVLQDISEQMVDMQHAINIKDKEKLEREIQILELLMFVGLLGIVVFAFGSDLTSALLNF